MDVFFLINLPPLLSSLVNLCQGDGFTTGQAARRGCEPFVRGGFIRRSTSRERIRYMCK